ncbi:MAG: hypothetical protein JO207_01395 [Verrucomicrobia bacterium]|nr:hypothetical protein [Verrucomicrobiota bacterium]
MSDSLICYLLAALCLTLWLRTFIPKPQQPTLEELYELNPKKARVRWLLLRTLRFVFPDVVNWWIDMEVLRRREKQKRRFRPK